jgi:hypothetical protein
MRCPRCGGCLHTDETDVRCINCGWMKNERYPEPMRDAYDRKKCRNCVKKVVPGTGYCASCAAYMVEYRKKKALA